MIDAATDRPPALLSNISNKNVALFRMRDANFRAKFVAIQITALIQQDI